MQHTAWSFNHVLPLELSTAVHGKRQSKLSFPFWFCTNNKSLYPPQYLTFYRGREFFSSCVSHISLPLMKQNCLLVKPLHLFYSVHWRHMEVVRVLRNSWFGQCFLYCALCALKWPLFTVYTSLASKAQFQISFSGYLSCIYTIRVEKALKMCLPCALPKRQYCRYKPSLSLSFALSLTLSLCFCVCLSVSPF